MAGSSTQALFVVLWLIQGSGEGRENRPQLRCGNASQTSFVHPNMHGTASRLAIGEGGGEVGPQGPAYAKSEDPTLNAHTFAMIAHDDRENFIAKMKRESSAPTD